MKRILAVVSAAALAAGGLSACSDSGAPRTGTLAVSLTDAPFPFDQVVSADVHVVRIDAKLAETSDEDANTDVESADDNENPSRGWVTIAEPNATLDLLQLQSGNTTNLGQTTLPVGRYRGFRLILDTQHSRITLKDGTVLEGNSTPGIVWPSAGLTGIKINLDRPFEVTGAGSLMVVDFDLGNSFVLRGNTIEENGLLFKPVIRATAHGETGSISGTVRSGESGTPAVEKASVQVLQPGTALEDTDQSKVVATATTSATGGYIVAFLLPGTYSLRVFPPSGSALKPALVSSVTVTAGAETGNMDVTLAP